MKITRTSIKAASDSDNEDYVEELAKQAAELVSNDSVWDVTYDIVAGMICFTVSDTGKQIATYIQPVGDISPDWSDLEADAQQLYSEILLAIEPSIVATTSANKNIDVVIY